MIRTVNGEHRRLAARKIGASHGEITGFQTPRKRERKLSRELLNLQVGPSEGAVTRWVCGCLKVCLPENGDGVRERGVKIEE